MLMIEVIKGHQSILLVNLQPIFSSFQRPMVLEYFKRHKKARAFAVYYFKRCQTRQKFNDPLEKLFHALYLHLFSFFSKHKKFVIMTTWRNDTRSFNNLFFLIHNCTKRNSSFFLSL